MDLEPTKNRSEKSVHRPPFEKQKVNMSGSGPSTNTLVNDEMSAEQIQEVFQTTTSDISRAAYELTFLVLRDQIDASVAAKSLANLESTTLEEVVDTIWLVSNEIKHFDTLPMERLYTFVRTLAKELPNTDTLLRLLPPDILANSQVLSDDRVFRKRLLRANTRNLYVQKKYNLLHEESEGYAKLVTELNGSSHTNHEGLTKRITSLIGHFNLDPNRVEDLVLEALELNIKQSHIYLPLIRRFRKKRLCHLVGHKFHAYHRSQGVNNDGNDGDKNSGKSGDTVESEASSSSSSSTIQAVPTPESLYQLAAVLISSKDLNVHDLLPHLLPSNKEIRDQRKVQELFILERAKNLGKISLGVTPEEKVKRNAERRLKQMQHKRDCDAASLYNQKFGILCGMFAIGAWDAAVEYINYLKSTGANPNGDSRVIRASCSFCRTLLVDAYKLLPLELNPSCLNLSKVNSNSNHTATNNGTSSSNATHEIFDELASLIGPVLSFIGEGISVDTVLFSKVCRLLRYIVHKLPNVFCKQTQKEWIEKIIVNVLLPGLAMVNPGNAGMANELWGLLKLFPFGERYRAYAKLKSELYSLRTPLVLRRAQIVEASRNKLRRLASETIKKQGRHLGKLALSNPVVVFTTILDQVEVYDNMIPTVVDCMKYMSELSYDVLSFVLIDKLASSRDKLKGDGVNISDWLQSLAIFTGTFYRRYPATELGGLLQYLVNCLEAKRSLDLIVFRELISKMTGIQVIDEISNDQLQGRSGGLVLRSQTNVLSRLSGSMRKAANSLHDAVIGKEDDDDTALCVVLLVLLAQQRNNIILDSSSQQLKLIGRLYDECHMTLVQFVDFLSTKCATASTKTASDASNAYCHILPNITTLLSLYKMEPGVAFHICRPSFSIFLRNGGLSSTDNEKNITPEGSGSSPVDEDVLSAVVQSLDGEVWKSMNPNLYSVFWSLSLYDIYTPSKKYETTKATLQNGLKRNETELRTLDQNSKAARDLRRDQRSKQNAIEDLNNEFRVQKDNERVIRRWLQQQKLTFIEGCERIENTPQCFLQHCVLPRALFSPEDAYFCALFTAILNELQVIFFFLISFILLK
jgi:THO complex subunit 2